MLAGAWWRWWRVPWSDAATASALVAAVRDGVRRFELSALGTTELADRLPDELSLGERSAGCGRAGGVVFAASVGGRRADCPPGRAHDDRLLAQVDRIARMLDGRIVVDAAAPG